MYTGSVPYECYEKSGSNSKITTITSTQSESDLVVMIKQGDILVRNAYIKAGDKYSFLLPNGTYQVFFYSGRGWNPGKAMPNGLKGGFVTDESYSKDSPTSLSYQEMVYELILQQNGNFSTQQSSEDEIF